MEAESRSFWDRFVARLDRLRHPIFFGALLVIVAGVYLSTKLSLRSDLSSLLPPSKRSVQDLAALQKRARSFGDVIVMVDAPDPATREKAGTELVAKLRAIDPRLVATVSTDDNTAARYGWEHRFLFASLDDLKAAHVAFENKLKKAHLSADPLWIDLGDPDDAQNKVSDDKLDALQKRLDDAERDALAPPLRLSPDGKAQLVTATVTFPSSDVGKGRTVIALVHAIGDHIVAAYPGTQVRYAGSINISIFEHDSVISGMAISAIITIVLVMVALFAYYRTALPVLGGLYALMTGVLFTLGFTQLTIGHLNLLSAFLTAIVVGNGINPGLIVLSRFGEEMRKGVSARAAVSPALSGSLHGTLAASLTAAVAYGALIVTDFRGFRHFGIIGGVGMIACWICAYTVLPVTLLWLDRRGAVKAHKPPAIGALLARLAPAPKRVGRALAFGGLIVIAAIAVTAHFLIDDPFQKDWRDLQADGGDIADQHKVDRIMSDRFAKTNKLTSPSYKLAMAVDTRAQVRPTVKMLRDLEAKRPKGQELFTDITSIDDLIPEDQDAKLAELDKIRPLFDDPIIDQIDEPDRSRMLRLKPPPKVDKIGEADIPEELKRLFVEQDGSVGRLIYVKGSPRFQTWNVEDRVVFAKLVRELPLPPGVIIGGEPLVIADIVESMKTDAPLMVLVSLLGSVIVVWLVVGYRRHGSITLVCGVAGVVVMIAACALAGLKVHFLDLIALPITIGIGIDYAVNLTARDKADGGTDTPAQLLSTTGGAVMLCSFTTTVGYGSLLLSSNGGVRAFGLAAILGELACITMALVLAPALLARWRQLSAD